MEKKCKSQNLIEYWQAPLFLSKDPIVFEAVDTLENINVIVKCKGKVSKQNLWNFAMKKWKVFEFLDVSDHYKAHKRNDLDIFLHLPYPKHLPASLLPYCHKRSQDIDFSGWIKLYNKSKGSSNIKYSWRLSNS